MPWRSPGEPGSGSMTLSAPGLMSTIIMNFTRCTWCTSASAEPCHLISTRDTVRGVFVLWCLRGVECEGGKPRSSASAHCACGGVHKDRGDPAASSRPSPLGEVCTSCYHRVITLSLPMVSPRNPTLSMLGENCYHGRRAVIGIKQTDRLGHMWVLGKTGTGKSTLLTNLIYADMQAGRGCMVIDPHGDLVEGLL